MHTLTPSDLTPKSYDELMHISQAIGATTSLGPADLAIASGPCLWSYASPEELLVTGKNEA